MTLKDKVDRAMPGWERWYPSLFDAAVDLGILRARVCAPSSLLLTNRHAAVRDEAQAMHRDRWGGDFSNEGVPSLEERRAAMGRRKKAKAKKKKAGKGGARGATAGSASRAAKGAGGSKARTSAGVSVTPHLPGSRRRPATRRGSD